MSALGCCVRLLSVSCKRRLSDWKQIWGTGGALPSSLDLMTHFLSCLVPQAVKRQSRCPEVPYHGTGGSTEYTSCRDRVSNRERHTPATRQQIKAHFPSRKLTSTHHSFTSYVQCIPGVILWLKCCSCAWKLLEDTLHLLHPVHLQELHQQQVFPVKKFKIKSMLFGFLAFLSTKAIVSGHMLSL